MSDFDLTKVDIETIAPILTKVSAAFEPTAPFLKFSVKPFSTYIKVFESMPKTSQDIASRACLFEFTEDGKLTATMSDGIFYGTTMVPYLERKDGFPTTFILDYESLLRVSVVLGHAVYLVYKDSSFYVEYDSGSLYVPSYSISPDKIKSRINHDASPDYKDVSVPSFLKHVELTKTFLASNQTKSSAFAFFMADGVYSCNGYTVFKGSCTVPVNVVFRSSDFGFLDTFVSLADEGLKMAVAGSRVILKSGNGMLSFPVYEEKYDESGLKRFRDFKPVNYYTVDYEKTVLLLTMLSKVYRTSNVVSLKSVAGCLKMSSSDLDGRESYATLSQKMAGSPLDATVTFSVTNLLAAFKTLEPYRFLNLAIFESSFGLFNADISMIVFGNQGEDKKVK